MSGLNSIRVSIICAIVVAATVSPSHAGPFHKFFRKVRYAFAHPDQSRHPHTVARTHPAGYRPNERVAEVRTDNRNVSLPPNGKNTRMATGVGSHKNTRADLPYGTPVPGKKGFVTSPFAPDSGYVDVREFAPGTQVKDPYTGKVFLTP